MTIIYLTRHSIPDRTKVNKSGTDIEQNMSMELSDEGIKFARAFFKKDEFSGIKKVYTSSYTRAIETGKVFKDEIVIDNRFDERFAGKPDFVDEFLTKNSYYYRQMIDENYKFPDGESRKDIESRMYSALENILNSNDEKVLIISHGAAMTFLLMKFCNIEMTDIENRVRKIIYDDKVIFENNFNYLETFKLTFDGFKLINVESIGNINDVL